VVVGCATLRFRLSRIAVGAPRPRRVASLSASALGCALRPARQCSHGSKSRDLTRAPRVTELDEPVRYRLQEVSVIQLAGQRTRAIGSSASITELAEPFGISRTGMKKHVRVLEEAGLVATRKVGRTRRCRLGPRHLEDVEQWIETYRRMLDERLDRFGELVERTKRGPGRPRRSP
jgi:DNA-binding transcriptional ArsR family regulator